MLFTTLTLGVFHPDSSGFWMGIIGLFIHFTGIGFIVPMSLSVALKPFHYARGSAGSLFGAAYYLVTAFLSWVMSYFHNGTTLPMGCYLLVLCFCLLFGTFLIRQPVKDFRIINLS